MSKIHVLEEEISNRIAAGEVIERPASAVKELIDNALDAGSNRIFVSIENGGSSLIQVSDNGCGMDQDDALLCLEAHATSKVRSADDLENIQTFGFRGEALPSIASVSRFELQTREKGSIEGTKVTVEGGKIRNCEAVGCAEGTRITIRNIFFNVPARKNFLKAKVTEESHIYETVLLLALSKPEVFFELKFNNRVVFSVPENKDISKRAAALFGRDIIAEMLPVNYDEDGIKITGLIARPGTTRSSRKEQRTFVNCRPVTSGIIYSGLNEAYHSLVIKGRHPPVLLYLQMKPNLFDINVHPAKREVRFRNQNMISFHVTNAVSNALRILAESAQIAAPSFLNQSSVQSRMIDLEPPQSIFSANTKKKSKLESDYDATANPIIRSVPIPVGNPQFNAPPPAASVPLPEKEDNGLEDLKIIGQLDKEYIIAENTKGMILINKKAAMERILFEKLLLNQQNKTPEKQPLLMPISIDIPAVDVVLMKKFKDQINNLGFEIEHFGGNTFAVSAIPSAIPQDNITTMIFDMIDELKEGSSGRKIQEAQLIQMVSRSAIGSASVLKNIEIDALMKDLRNAQMPYSCPRGKPVLIHISKNELGRRFGIKK